MSSAPALFSGQLFVKHLPQCVVQTLGYETSPAPRYKELLTIQNYYIFFCFLNELSTTRSSAPTPFSVRHRILPAMGLRSRSSRSPMISSCRGWPCGWHPPEPECRPGSGGTHPQKTLQSQDLLVNVFLTMTASFLSQVLIALFHAVVKQLLVRPDRWYLITEHFSIHAGPDFKSL